MTKFNIMEANAEFSKLIGKGELIVKAGEALNKDENQKTLKTFDTLEEARAELAKYTAYIGSAKTYNGHYYIDATDYYIQEVEVDEDGNEIEYYSIWDFAK